MRGATYDDYHFDIYQNVSIHAPYAGSDGTHPARIAKLYVSIHAPYAGSDPILRRASETNRCFNPRSLCGERPTVSGSGSIQRLFQSTLPMRGATVPTLLASQNFMFQSTLPMRGATEGDEGDEVSEAFQSTLPMRGATRYVLDPRADLGMFQSTLPMRGATTISLEEAPHFIVSIHAPYAGSDLKKRG